MTQLAKSVLLIVALTIQACNSIVEVQSDPLVKAQKPAQAGVIYWDADKKLQLTGRFQLTENDGAQFTWPGSALTFQFEGREASIDITSNDRVRFNVNVNGSDRDLWVTKGTHRYPLLEKQKYGVYRVTITRATESFTITTAFASKPFIDDGTLLTAPKEPARHLLVFGDSITAGYGVEGQDESCGYAHETSTALKAYAYLASQNLNSNLHIIAWSGIGVWRSYGEKQPVNPTILNRYSLTLANNFTQRWGVDQFMPDAILVAIGTNDYWDGSPGQYKPAMGKFIQALQRDYGSTPIYLIVSPMLRGDARDDQASVLNSYSGDRVKILDLGRIEASDGYGCDYHPNTVTQTRMATSLVERLKKDLHW